ncbi:MAG TPA: NUDIX domain-containing protein [Saprospiraceae bacterium]|nr:NUDIX domain-containing protein [Saprospiraceae bacterium]
MQIYKIYLNERTLVLADLEFAQSPTAKEFDLIHSYSGQKKSLFQYLDLMEKSGKIQQILLWYSEPEKIMKDLKEICIKIKAAGGIIEDLEQSKILIMKRRGFYDLPKGKLDDNEKYKQAAIRECQEETGLQQLTLKEGLLTTYHIYRDRDHKRCLKKTKWFHLIGSAQETLIPQTTEDITELFWTYPEDVSALKPIYKSVLECFEQFSRLKLNS